MEDLLTKLSKRTKTVITLGQVGSDCKNKTVPNPTFSSLDIPNHYGWKLAPVLWNATLDIIKEKSLNVQVVDAREPVMQSVHAHPVPDCLHFCMNSAAVNIYLDIYWNEVFQLLSGPATPPMGQRTKTKQLVDFISPVGTGSTHKMSICHTTTQMICV
jgi:hypothetical protein